jgi:hypothetical protein
MKAEVRKQLETNTLADQMGRLFKGGGKSASAIWVLLGVAGVVGILYWWLTGTLASRAADAWTRLWMAQQAQASFLPTPIDRDLINSPAALGAELVAADAKFSAARSPFNVDPQASALFYEEAARAYIDLANRSANVPEVHLRALAGAGKSYESMGQLKAALEFYEALIASARNNNLFDHPLMAEANRKVALLAAAGAGRDFYEGWPQRLPRSVPQVPGAAPTPPPMPSLPALIDPAATTPAPGGQEPSPFLPPRATLPASTMPNFVPPAAPTAPAPTTPVPAAPAPTRGAKPAETKPASTSPAR